MFVFLKKRRLEPQRRKHLLLAVLPVPVLVRADASECKCHDIVVTLLMDRSDFPISLLVGWFASWCHYAGTLLGILCDS